MQPVRKKTQNKKLRAFFLVPLLLAVGALLFFLLTKPDVANQMHQHDDEPIALIHIKPEELLSFTVFPRNNKAFTLERNGETFAVKGNADFPLDQDQLDLMVKDLTVLTVNELAGEVHLEEEHLAELGLGKAAARVTARYADDSSITLVFGDSAQTEIPSDYIMIAGDNKVYTISQETRDHFDRSLASLHPTPAINFNADLVTRIEISGSEPLVLQQEEGLWEILSPFSYPADKEAISRLLNSISKMRFAVYAGEADDENKAQFGFNTGCRTVTFHLAPSIITGYDEEGLAVSQERVPEQRITLSLGDRIDNIGLYTLYEGEIYQSTNASMGFLSELSLSGLLSPNPFTLPINRVQSLTVSNGSEERAYQIELIESVLPNNEIAKDELGNTLYEPYISLDDREVNQEDFVREYLRLMQTKRTGKLPEDFQAEQKAVLRYQLVKLDGKELIVAFYPLDALHYAMQVNGTFVDYITRAAVDAIDL